MRIFLGLLAFSFFLIAGCDFDNDWTSADLDVDKPQPEDDDTTSVQKPPVNQTIDWCEQSNC